MIWVIEYYDIETEHSDVMYIYLGVASDNVALNFSGISVRNIPCPIMGVRPFVGVDKIRNRGNGAVGG